MRTHWSHCRDCDVSLTTREYMSAELCDACRARRDPGVITTSGSGPPTSSTTQSPSTAPGLQNSQVPKGEEGK